jgi:hypothetical protein
LFHGNATLSFLLSPLAFLTSIPTPTPLSRRFKHLLTRTQRLCVTKKQGEGKREIERVRKRKKERVREREREREREGRGKNR